jgi:hypothetical protein
MHRPPFVRSQISPLLAVCIASNLLSAVEEQPFGIERRIPWTTSRVVGSPEPPLPYTVEKTFTNLTWKAPIFLTPEPETDWLCVVQAGDDKGPSKILRVRDDPQADRVETFLELKDRLIYSVAFHPEYRTNGHIYLFTHGSAGEFKARTVSHVSLSGVRRRTNVIRNRSTSSSSGTRRGMTAAASCSVATGCSTFPPGTERLIQMDGSAARI